MSKLHGEEIVLNCLRERQLPVVVLRPGAYYGPLGQYAFNRLFFKDPMRGIIMQVNGGRYIIFPVYIADVVQGIMKALERGQLGEVYNICGDSISHKQAFDIICQEANLRWPRLPVPGWLGITMSRFLTMLSNLTHTEPFWPINLRSYVYNNWRVSSDKARRELGFVPTDFREGARRTIAWYRAGEPDILPELECVSK
jgi:nucleoside-diphosphate-sugar epimerase